MKQLPVILVIALFGVLCSCEKKKTQVTVTDAMARDTLYYIMNDWYYWYKEMPAIDKEIYTNPYNLLTALRYKEYDRWSFVADYEEFISEMNGEFYGHGVSIGVDTDGKARIAMIYSESPLYKAGVRRGWIVKTINGFDIAEVITGRDNTTYTYIFGLTSSDFVFEKPDGTQMTFTSTKSSFTVNTVLHADTLHLKSGTTGHLVFESFILSSSAELEKAFDFFKKNNVNNLILDLRYNTGGSLGVAQELASYIIGNNHEDDVFAALTYNDKRQRYNQPFFFGETDYPLNISNLVVISSRSTASASEAVINGLKPFINVIQVGDTTYGKPMGMDGWYCGKKYVFYPVTFKLVNSEGVGDYFEGIYPDIFALDDLKNDFSDRNEGCLREAIEYLETGDLEGEEIKGEYHPGFNSEKPEWMYNVFTVNGTNY